MLNVTNTSGFKSGFDSFPTKAQTALFDMIFNLGFTTLKDKFTKFNDSIKKEDWAAAAKQSNRPQISSLRNGYVKGLFNGIPKTITTAKP